jgi:hypothetical protein
MKIQICAIDLAPDIDIAGTLFIVTNNSMQML